jgi:hypothetical protein
LAIEGVVASGLAPTYQPPQRSARGLAYTDGNSVQLRPLECRLVNFVLIEEVEDRPLLRIEGHDLDGLAVVHLADIDVIVEIQCARMVRRDFRVLEAGLGKYQGLGFDLQQLEHRLQVAAIPFKGESRRTAFNLLLESGDRIVHIRRPVVDRLIRKRHITLIAYRDLCLRRHCGNATGQRQNDGK